MSRTIIFLALLLMLAGCSTGGLFNKKPNTGPPKSAKEMMQDAVSQTNYMVVVSVIGCSLSVAAITYGAGKLGIAGLAGSFTCLVMSLATIRYAWVFAILGVVTGVLVLINSYMKNKKTIVGFVQGFQEVKNRFINENRTVTTPERDKQLANETMGQHLTPEGEKYVKKIKAKSNDRTRNDDELHTVPNAETT